MKWDENFSDTYLVKKGKNNPIEELEVGGVNLFVGVNNGGKSYLIRKILKKFLEDRFTDEFAAPFYPDDKLLGQIGKTATGITSNVLKPWKEAYKFDGIDQTITLQSISINKESHHIGNIEQALNDIGRLDQVFASQSMDLVRKFIEDGHRVLSGVCNLDEATGMQGKQNGSNRPTPIRDSDRQAIVNYFSVHLKELLGMLEPIVALKNAELIYIPAIRMIRRYSEGKTIMEDTSVITMQTVKDYFGGEGENKPKIIDGQNIFNDFYKMRNSSKESMDKLNDYQNYLANEFFYGEEVFFVTDMSVESPVLRVKVGESKERAIHELGDGIQQIIILTYPIFFNDSGILFVEEPEQNLHPGLQKKLYDLYVSKTDNFQFYIVSHSNHLIDQSIRHDSQIYKVSKSTQEGKDAFYVSSELGDILGELGVLASSVLTSNGIVWVEGPTDVMYIQYWIDLFLKQEAGSVGNNKLPIKGLDYTIIPLPTSIWKYVGSGNEDSIGEKEISEFINLITVNKNNLVVIDRDTDYKPNLYPSKYEEFKSKKNDKHKQGVNKAKLIHNLMYARNVKESELILNEDDIYDGMLKDGTMAYWVNSGTVETYLRKLIGQTVRYKDQFAAYFASVDGYYSLSPGTDKKMYISRKITDDDELKFSDFAGKEDDLYKKIDALIKTIQGWMSYKH